MRLAVIGCFLVTAQAAAGIFWVQLAPKDPPLSRLALRNQAALSPRSLERRARLGVNLDLRDIPVSSDRVATIAQMVEKIRTRSRWLNAVSVEATKKQIDEIRSLSFVVSIRGVASGTRAVPPKQVGPALKQSTRTSAGGFDYGSSLWQVERIGVTKLHDDGLTGQGVLICVLDAGFNGLDHESLVDLDIVATSDFVSHTTVEGHNHGTSVLSTLAGFVPGALIGPAFGASFALGRTEIVDKEIKAEEDNWIAGAEWADSLGADILNSSLSYTIWDEGSPDPDYSLDDLDGATAAITIVADLAVSKGIVVIASAGNDRGAEQTVGWEGRIGFPADGVEVLTIGATTPDDNVASFSSIGPTADGRIKPDLAAPGQSVSFANPSNPTSYSLGQGTSFSCPLVSGLVGLLLEAHQDWGPAEIRKALVWTARDLRTPGPDNYSGYGLVDGATAVRLDFDGGLFGTVLAQGLPVAGASVDVTTPDSVLSAITDERGRFVLGAISAGEHSVAASALGFNTSFETITVPQMSPAELEMTPAVGQTASFRFHPNPVRSQETQTTLSGVVTADMSISIHSLSGDLVRRLPLGRLTWDLRNGSGRLVAAGVYLYRVDGGDGRTGMGKLAVIR